MFKRAKVVMLSTNQKAQLVLGQQLANVGETNIDNDEEITKQHLYIISDDKIKKSDWYINFVSKPTVVQSKNKNAKSFYNSDKARKIIATTDNSLKIKAVNKNTCKPIDSHIMHKYKNMHFPQPSQAFIKKYIDEYNKGNIITDVLVEYEVAVPTMTAFLDYNPKKHGTSHVKIKINSKDNTITIKKVKDIWDRQEVEKLCRKSYEAGQNNILGQDEWIEENL